MTFAHEPYSPLALVFLIWAYAEIHYRFRFIPSRYYLPLPEIVADLPWRIEPGQDVPILLLIKDAHRFPIVLEHIRIEIRGGEGPERCQTFTFNARIDSHWWHRVVSLPRHAEDAGLRQINVHIYLKQGDTDYHFINDNYRILPRKPFDVFFATELLPRLPDFYAGDLHTHSRYTEDQVEFGAPPRAMVPLAQAAGFHFLAITDHSYDLDDDPQNYLRNDPDRRKWQAFLQEVASLHSPSFVVLPGEEVSCGNANRRNVHLLILNHERFVPGAGDSAEKWLRTDPDLSIETILKQAEPQALYFAAHPGAVPPFLERQLLGRGAWDAIDVRHSGLHGLQIWNGEKEDVQRAERLWVETLLQGRRLRIIAGSDAHGNFGRYRQIQMPHWKMRQEPRFHVFGLHRTLAWLPEGLSRETVLQALAEGHTSLSEGPALVLFAYAPDRPPVPMGGVLRRSCGYLHITALSSSEFGGLIRLILYLGRIGAEREEVFLDIPLQGQSAYDAHLPIRTTEPVYYRAEVVSRTPEGRLLRAITNPIWHQPEAPASIL